MNDNAGMIYQFLEQGCEACLGTSDGGLPHLSAVGYLYDPEKKTEASHGTVYMLLSDLARHTQILRKNPEAALFVIEAEGGKPVYEKKRLTVTGRVGLVEDPGKIGTLKAAYLKAFPDSKVFFTLADFCFYAMPVRELIWYGGFGRALTGR